MIRNFSDWRQGKSTSLMVASFTNLPLVAHHSMRMKIGRHPKTLLSHSINADQRGSGRLARWRCSRPDRWLAYWPTGRAAFCVNRISVDE